MDAGQMPPKHPAVVRTSAQADGQLIPPEVEVEVEANHESSVVP
jgi:hypothetical protein